MRFPTGRTLHIVWRRSWAHHDEGVSYGSRSASTAFLATAECVDVADEYKDLIVASDGEDTTFTHSYDIVSGIPWPPELAVRVRRNEFTESWHGRDEELLADRAIMAAELRTAAKPFNAAETPTYFGESAAGVRRVSTVAELIDELTTGAARVLSNRVFELGLEAPAAAKGR